MSAAHSHKVICVTVWPDSCRNWIFIHRDQPAPFRRGLGVYERVTEASRRRLEALFPRATYVDRRPDGATGYYFVPRDSWARFLIPEGE
jgi:hypothetical protein